MGNASRFSVPTRVKKTILLLTVPAFIMTCLGSGCSGTGAGGNASNNPNTPPIAGGENPTNPPPDLTSVGIAGKTYYVATNGDDSSPGTLAAPFRTIGMAAGVVKPGDTIEVREGVYAGGLMIRSRGTQEAWIKIKPYQQEHVVVDGAGADVNMYFLDGSWSVDSQEPMHWIVEGLEISGGNVYAVKIDAPFVRLVNNNIHGSQNDIVKLVRTANDVTIYGNEIHHNIAAAGANAQGIDITGPDRTWVAHNYVHDTVSIGIYSKGNAHYSLFENNRVENIASRGIMLGQNTGAEFMKPGEVYETYDGIIRNNVIINTSDACLATASSINVKIYNNSCYNAASRSHGGIFVSNESEIGQAGTNVEIKNNIVVTSGSDRPAVKIGPGAMTDMQTLHIDNNIYWTMNGSEPTFTWDDTAALYNVPVSAWRNASGQDANSKLIDPRYLDTTDLKLATGSPAIDAGVATDVVRFDFNEIARPIGAAIDIGAQEFGG